MSYTSVAGWQGRGSAINTHCVATATHNRQAGSGRPWQALPGSKHCWSRPDLAAVAAALLTHHTSLCFAQRHVAGAPQTLCTPCVFHCTRGSPCQRTYRPRLHTCLEYRHQKACSRRHHCRSPLSERVMGCIWGKQWWCLMPLRVCAAAVTRQVVVLNRVWVGKGNIKKQLEW